MAPRLVSGKKRAGNSEGGKMGSTEPITNSTCAVRPVHSSLSDLNTPPSSSSSRRLSPTSTLHDRNRLMRNSTHSDSNDRIGSFDGASTVQNARDLKNTAPFVSGKDTFTASKILSKMNKAVHETPKENSADAAKEHRVGDNKHRVGKEEIAGRKIAGDAAAANIVEKVGKDEKGDQSGKPRAKRRSSLRVAQASVISREDKPEPVSSKHTKRTPTPQPKRGRNSKRRKAKPALSQSPCCIYCERPFNVDTLIHCKECNVYFHGMCSLEANSRSNDTDFDCESCTERYCEVNASVSDKHLNCTCELCEGPNGLLSHRKQLLLKLVKGAFSPRGTQNSFNDRNGTI